MKYYAGLDVSLEETAVCVIDSDGAVVAEAKVSSEPVEGRRAGLDQIRETSPHACGASSAL